MCVLSGGKKNKEKKALSALIGTKTEVIFVIEKNLSTVWHLLWRLPLRCLSACYPRGLLVFWCFCCRSFCPSTHLSQSVLSIVFTLLHVPVPLRPAIVVLPRRVCRSPCCAEDRRAGGCSASATLWRSWGALVRSCGALVALLLWPVRNPLLWLASVDWAL